MENIEMPGCICQSPNILKLKELKDEMGDRCKVYCETGCLYGGSMILQMSSATPCFFIGIDLFSGYYGSTYDPHRQIDLQDHLNIVKENIDKNNPHNHQYELIKGDSTDKSIAEKVGTEIDYLFIDGDHSQQGVHGDFINYKDKVSKGGIVVFDNYNDPNWREVKPVVDNLCYLFKNEFRVKEKVLHMCVLEKI